MSLLLHAAPAWPDGKSAASTPPARAIGLTVGKVMGKAVDRNRIKRRMRECIRTQRRAVTPGRCDPASAASVIELEFAKLEREVAQVFRAIQAALDKAAAAATQCSGSRRDCTTAR